MLTHLPQRITNNFLGYWRSSCCFGNATGIALHPYTIVYHVASHGYGFDYPKLLDIHSVTYFLGD